MSRSLQAVSAIAALSTPSTPCLKLRRRGVVVDRAAECSFGAGGLDGVDEGLCHCERLARAAAEVYLNLARSMPLRSTGTSAASCTLKPSEVTPLVRTSRALALASSAVSATMSWRVSQSLSVRVPRT